MIKYCKKHERYHGEKCIDCIRKNPTVKQRDTDLKKALEIVAKESLIALKKKEVKK